MGQCYSQCSELSLLEDKLLFEHDWSSNRSVSVSADNTTDLTNHALLDQDQEAGQGMNAAYLGKSPQWSDLWTVPFIRKRVLQFMSLHESVALLRVSPAYTLLLGKDITLKVLARYFPQPAQALSLLKRTKTIDASKQSLRLVQQLAQTYDLSQLWTQTSAKSAIICSVQHVSQLSTHQQLTQLKETSGVDSQLIRYLAQRFFTDPDQDLQDVVEQFCRDSVQLVLSDLRLGALFQSSKTSRCLELFRYKLLYLFTSLCTTQQSRTRTKQLLLDELRVRQWLRYVSLSQFWKEQLVQAIPDLDQVSPRFSLWFWRDGVLYETSLRKSLNSFPLVEVEGSRQLPVLILDGRVEMAERLLRWSSHQLDRSLGDILHSGWSAGFVCECTLGELEELVESSRSLGIFELETVCLMFRSWTPGSGGERGRRLASIPQVQDYVRRRFPAESEVILGLGVEKGSCE